MSSRKARRCWHAGSAHRATGGVESTREQCRPVIRKRMQIRRPVSPVGVDAEEAPCDACRPQVRGQHAFFPPDVAFATIAARRPPVLLFASATPPPLQSSNEVESGFRR